LPKVKANLNKCTLQDKKKALNALDFQVIAVPEKMKIRIAVPLEFITIEQTSVCTFTHNKIHTCQMAYSSVCMFIYNFVDLSP